MGDDDDMILRCSMCDDILETLEGSPAFVVGPNVLICEPCIDQAKLILDRTKTRKNVLASLDLVSPPPAIEDEEVVITPHGTKSKLDKHVIGQEHAKKVLSVAVYNHYKRLSQEAEFGFTTIKKSNIMLLGPTGSGKTLIASTLAAAVELPFAVADATTFTEAGYVGEDVEYALAKLYQSADSDITATERGIIYIDEIDKIAADPATSKDVGGRSVQQALLKMVEGSSVKFYPIGSNKHSGGRQIEVDTTNILFIVGGAFADLHTIISARTEKSGIGFGAKVIGEDDAKELSRLVKLGEPEDLVTFGLIPEFVGRFPVIAALDSLDEDALMRILTEPEDSIVSQFQEIFDMDGIELVFEPDALREIAKLAIKRKSGARGLRSVVETILMDSMFEVPSDQTISTVTVTAENVRNNTKPVYTHISEDEIVEPGNEALDK